AGGAIEQSSGVTLKRLAKLFHRAPPTLLLKIGPRTLGAAPTFLWPRRRCFPPHRSWGIKLHLDCHSRAGPRWEKAPGWPQVKGSLASSSGGVSLIHPSASAQSQEHACEDFSKETNH